MTEVSQPNVLPVPAIKNLSSARKQFCEQWANTLNADRADRTPQ